MKLFPTTIVEKLRPKFAEWAEVVLPMLLGAVIGVNLVLMAYAFVTVTHEMRVRFLDQPLQRIESKVDGLLERQS